MDWLTNENVAVEEWELISWKQIQNVALRGKFWLGCALCLCCSCVISGWFSVLIAMPLSWQMGKILVDHSAISDIHVLVIYFSACKYCCWFLSLDKVTLALMHTACQLSCKAMTCHFTSHFWRAPAMLKPYLQLAGADRSTLQVY